MAPQRPEDGFIRIPEHEFEAILARDATEDAWCWPNFRPATLLVFARPGFHVAQGGGFEMRASDMSAGSGLRVTSSTMSRALRARSSRRSSDDSSTT